MWPSRPNLNLYSPSCFHPLPLSVPIPQLECICRGRRDRLSIGRRDGPSGHPAGGVDRLLFVQGEIGVPGKRYFTNR